ncbi:hypothetical protein HID58_048142, partial [Brassica napus]
VRRDTDVFPDELNDNNRKYYHMKHIMALHGAVWSEWEDGYKRRTGLYNVDYAHNLGRHEK